MNIVIKVLGTEVLNISTGTEAAEKPRPVTGAPDYVSSHVPVGFRGPYQGVPYA